MVHGKFPDRRKEKLSGCYFFEEARYGFG